MTYFVLPPFLANPVRFCELSQACFRRFQEFVGIWIQPGGLPPTPEPLEHRPDRVWAAYNMRKNQHRARPGRLGMALSGAARPI